MKAWPLIIVCVLQFACNTKEDDKKRLLIGTWQHFKPPLVVAKNISLVPPPLAAYPVTGMSFKENGQFENKDGFRSKEFPYKYLGDFSRFKLFHDSLKIYNIGERRWLDFKIIKLVQDTLILQQNHRLSAYVRWNTSERFDQKFDAIKLTYNISILEVSKSGDVYYKGLLGNVKGEFKAKISRQDYRDLQENFNQIDLSTLRDTYASDATDQVLTTVSFIKNNKVIKSVSDYGHASPYPFQWAYTAMRRLPDQIHLVRMP